MNRNEFASLLERLVPEVEVEEYMVPEPRRILDAEEVFDALREACDPPVSKEEFNSLCGRLGLPTGRK